MIPRVRKWKVTDHDTGRSVEVETINKRFARWIATTDHGMWGPKSVSVVKPRMVMNMDDKGFRRWWK